MIKKQMECEINMRVLITVDDEAVIADTIAKYGKRDTYLAKDDNVANRRAAQAAGLGRYALVGADADADVYDEVIGKAAPKKSDKKPYKPAKKASPKSLDTDIEAVVDDESE